MSNKGIPFHKPFINENEINEVVDTLKSGWLTSGPKVKLFEQKFESLYPIGFNALAVSSATAGLHLALQSYGIKRDDEVIIPTHTFTATAEVIEYMGAKPIFSDIEKDTLCLSTKKIEPLITKKTKLIMPVHFGGLPCDNDKIYELASKYSLNVIEDAAHAFPAKYKGKLLGSNDNGIKVFSFYANKTITTGEGGMIVVKDKNLSNRMSIMRTHGIDRDVYGRYTSIKKSSFYQVVAAGFKYNMQDLSACLGIHQLDKAFIMNEKRARIAAIYDDNFSDLPVILPSKACGNSTHAWHLYVLRLEENLSIYRDEVVDYLTEAKIGTSLHYIPLHRHKYWQEKYNLDSHEFPNSDMAYLSSISLPIYCQMSNEDIEYICSKVKEAINKICFK